MRQDFCQALFRIFSHWILAAALTCACVKLPRRTDLAARDVSTRATQTVAPHRIEPAQPSTHFNRATTPVSINLAPRSELERLPGVGPALAARIVEHRERHGPFRRVEHLLLVRGISERRLRELRPFITTQ